MNKQAAMNTFLTLSAFGLAGAGYAGMMTIAPKFTAIVTVLIGIGFLVKAIYTLETMRLEDTTKE